MVQLLSKHLDLKDQAIELFRKYGSDVKRAISSDDYLDLFQSQMRKFSTFTIVIDALDEGAEVEEFTKGFESMITIPDVVVRVLVTGRNDYSLQRSVGVSATYHISLEGNIDDDIQSFIEYEVEYRIQTRRLKVRSDELKTHIIHSLSKGAQGM